MLNNYFPILRCRRVAKRDFSELIYLDKTFNSESCKVPDVLYVGDSVLERISNHDLIKKTLKEMVEEALGVGTGFSAVSKSAYNPAVYYHIALALTKMRYLPKILVVPINMRSFSPQWDANPDWQFDEEINALKSFAGSRSKVLPQLSYKRKLSIKRFLYEWTLTRYSFTELKQVKEFKQVISRKSDDPEWMKYRLMQIFIFHYLYRLKPNHKKIQYLVKLVRLCNDAGIRILFYLTPINYQTAIQYVGNDFDRVFKRNINAVMAAISVTSQVDGVIIKNYIDLLSPEFFFHTKDPTEHLCDDGRHLLAQELAITINDMLKVK